MSEWYVSMEVHGYVAAMVEARSLTAAKKKILDMDRSCDFMDISLTEVKVAKPTTRKLRAAQAEGE